MDAIHYKVKEDHRYITKAAYVVLGITMDGRKDILGVWIGEHESSKFWLNVLNELKSRGVTDVYLFCTDGLCGMMQAIEAVFPNSRLQRCIVHQARASTRYVNWKSGEAALCGLPSKGGEFPLDALWDKITEWLKELPISGITDNLIGLFDAANQKVAEISGQVGMTPQAWNGGIFSMIQTLFVGICTWALSICIFIVTYGRMIEIYLATSIAPIQMATMMGKEWGGMGQNYIRKAPGKVCVIDSV